MIKEQIRESTDGVAQKQCKWRNHFFDKNGRVYRGQNWWGSQELAEHNAQLLLKEFRERSTKDTRIFLNSVDGHLFAEDYSWHMQLPVLE